MTDKELADKVVALGVGEKDTFRSDMYTLGKFHSVRYEADEYVRDWRVAGALMEKFGNDHDRLMKALIHACAMMVCIPPRGPLSHAIIAACMEALSDE